MDIVDIGLGSVNHRVHIPHKLLLLCSLVGNRLRAAHSPTNTDHAGNRSRLVSSSWWLEIGECPSSESISMYWHIDLEVCVYTFLFEPSTNLSSPNQKVEGQFYNLIFSDFHVPDLADQHFDVIRHCNSRLGPVFGRWDLAKGNRSPTTRISLRLPVLDR